MVRLIRRADSPQRTAGSWKLEAGSSSPPLLAPAEEREQRPDVRRIGRDLDLVDPGLPENATERIALVADRARVVGAHAAAAAVDDDPLARLRIGEHEQPGVRQLRLARIADAHRDQVVALADQLHRALQRIHAARPDLEVGQHEDDGAMAQQPTGKVQRGRDRRAVPLRTERQHVADHAQRVASPLPRRHEVLDDVGEDEQADAVVVARRGQREDGRDLGGELGLEAATRAELLGAGQVYGEEHGQLALLDVLLHVGSRRARGDVPVDVAYVVTRLVLAYFRELDPLPLEDGVVFAAEQRVDPAARAQLDQADLLEHLARHGVPRAARAATTARGGRVERGGGRSRGRG